MKDRTETKINDFFFVLMVIIVGIFLRLFHLGLNGFWFDEIGVANVAYADNFLEILRISKSHVMAMPFDYLVTYLVSTIDNSEFALRLPSMIWGSISILALYLLSMRLSANKKIALVSAFLFAISPIHIYYSQELRFYAVLVFFVLASTIALRHAIVYPKMKNWLLYHVVVLIGCFFHVYVLFVLVLGGIWLGLLWLKKQLDNQIIGQFVITNFNVLLIVFAGVYLLTSNQHTGTAYANYITTISKSIAGGLGFSPLYLDPYPVIIGISLVLFLLPFLTGWIDFIKGRHGIWNQGIGLFVPLAVIIVLSFDLMKAYYIQPRQFLFILPFVLYITANGLIGLVDTLKSKMGWKRKPAGSLLFLYLACLVFLNGFSLVQYYRQPKSYVREIVSQLAYPLDKENTIYISPNYDVGSFLYYYQKEFGEKYSGRLIGFEGNKINDINFIPGDMVMVNPKLDPIDLPWLERNHFQPVMITHPLQNTETSLWLLPDVAE